MTVRTIPSIPPVSNSDGLDPDVHAFLAWFDVSFECTHKKVKFSTGPHAQYTHWKSVSLPSHPPARR